MDDGLTSRMEEMAEQVAGRVHANIQSLMEIIGERPWQGRQLSREEQLAAYRQVREESLFWQDRLQREGQALKLGPAVMPRSLIEDAIAMERRHQKE